VNHASFIGTVGHFVPVGGRCGCTRIYTTTQCWASQWGKFEKYIYLYIISKIFHYVDTGLFQFQPHRWCSTFH